MGKDIAVTSGDKDTVNALKARADREDKGVVDSTTPEENKKVTIINESVLYSLAQICNLPLTLRWH